MVTTQHKQLATGMTLMSVSNLLQKATGFLLLPVYTRFLTPEDYGYVSLFILSIAIAEIFVRQGLHSALLRHIGLNHDDLAGEDARRCYGTTLIYCLAVGLIAGAVICLGSVPISQLLFDTPALYYLVLLGAAQLVLQVIAGILVTALQSHQKYFYLAAISFFVFLGKLTGNLIALLVFRAGFASLIYGNLIGVVIEVGALVVLARPYIQLTYDRVVLRELQRFGRPLILSAIGFMVFSATDRFMLKWFQTVTVVGLYTLGMQLAEVVETVVLAPFRRTWPTVHYRIAKQDNAREEFATLALRFWCGGLLAAVGMQVGAPYVIRVLAPPTFYGAADVAAIIVLGRVLFTINDILKVGINITGRTYLMPVRVCVSGVVNVIANLLLIPPFGFMGAAVATMLSFVFFNVFTILVSRSFYAVPYQWPRVVLATSAAAAVWLAATWLPAASWSMLVPKVLLVGLLTIVLARVADISILRTLDQLYRLARRMLSGMMRRRVDTSSVGS